MSVDAVVWLIVGVRHGQAELETRRAVTTLRRNGFEANVASPDALLLKADELRAHQHNKERPVIEQ